MSHRISGGFIHKTLLRSMTIDCWVFALCAIRNRLPVGTLSTAYPVGAYPFADGTPLDWREEVDGWLVGLANHIYRTVKFPLALTGHEVEFEIDLADIAASGIPEVRWDGYLWPENDTLKWYQPNQGAPHVIGKWPEDSSPGSTS